LLNFEITGVEYAQDPLPRKRSRVDEATAKGLDAMVSVTKDAIVQVVLAETGGYLFGRGLGWLVGRLASSSAKGLSVIGPRATYAQFAKDIGANYLKLAPKEVWTWEKNLKFLEGVANRGDDVLFAGKFDPAKLAPGTALADEIGYLISKGYKWTDDFTKLVK
jgi:hypothetical protein